MYRHKYKKYKNKYMSLKRTANINYNMTFNNRLLIYDMIKNHVISQDDCIDKHIFLNKGGSGNIYIKTLDEYNIKIALKEQPINYKSRLEYDMLKKTTDLVINKVTQNVPMIYNTLDCNNKIIMYCELATNDFSKWYYDVHTDEEWLSFLFQLWSGVYVLQKHLNLVHNDLRYGNVLFHKINKTDEYWKYTIDDDDYYIPNCGYVFVIWDFGSSHIINNNDNNKKRFELNSDMFAFHDLYNRLHVLKLTELYTTNELEEFFISDKDKTNMNKFKNKHIKHGDRADTNYKLDMAYYLFEQNRYNEINIHATNKKTVQFPSTNILKILKSISDNHNYNYDEFQKMYKYNKYDDIQKKIPSLPILIKQYLNMYSIKKEYTLHFKI